MTDVRPELVENCDVERRVVMFWLGAKNRGGKEGGGAVAEMCRSVGT